MQNHSFSFFHNGPVNINTASYFLVKFLCGDDDGLYEDILTGPSGTSGDPFFKNMNDPKLAQMRNNRSISTSTTATVFRVLVTVSKGKANFQLHAILGRGDAMQSQPSGKGQVQKPRSQQNSKIRYPFRILSIRENENLVD